MFCCGDTVVIYGGYIDSSGERTTVEIAKVVEVGRYELLVTLANRSWSAVRVPKSRCNRVNGKFKKEDPIPLPSIGDLVLINKYDIAGRKDKQRVGTVQTIEFMPSDDIAHILVDGEIKKIALKDCMILQINSKKT